MQRLRVWLEHIPLASSQERRQALLLRAMLLILLVGSLLTLPVNLLLSTPPLVTVLLVGAQGARNAR